MTNQKGDKGIIKKGKGRKRKKNNHNEKQNRKRKNKKREKNVSESLVISKFVIQVTFLFEIFSFNKNSVFIEYIL